MGPSVEKFADGAFIPSDVKVLIKEAEPVPLIAGITEQEGYMYIFSKALFGTEANTLSSSFDGLFIIIIFVGSSFQRNGIGIRSVSTN